MQTRCGLKAVFVFFVGPIDASIKPVLKESSLLTSAVAISSGYAIAILSADMKTTVLGQAMSMLYETWVTWERNPSTVSWWNIFENFVFDLHTAPRQTPWQKFKMNSWEWSQWSRVIWQTRWPHASYTKSRFLPQFWQWVAWWNSQPARVLPCCLTPNQWSLAFDRCWACMVSGALFSDLTAQVLECSDPS